MVVGLKESTTPHFQSGRARGSSAGHGKMLVVFFNIVKVESVPLNFNFSDQFPRGTFGPSFRAFEHMIDQWWSGCRSGIPGSPSGTRFGRSARPSGC
ncbi:hypothetical protein MHPYR_210092 [uncultured Mycobacterium sp.]|uniref:Uncharacterized protein n=1 Tax=uncultured Mycobacterium sp. TaxID=171292 RepID=A0A1Y5P9K5_9MYCO|nr:hypothetical protein MHPYR_210092 [uncultured Mycobacterium sp.]